MNRIAYLICVLLLAAPVHALEWVIEGETRACKFGATNDCQGSVADFSALVPPCTHFITKFHTEWEDLVSPDTDAAATLHQCTSASAIVGGPGCSPARVFPTGGPGLITSHGFFKVVQGEFFNIVIDTVPGATNAMLSVSCVREAADRSATVWVGEIAHTGGTFPMGAGDKVVIPANPNRNKLTVINLPGSIASIYWSSEEGGMGGTATCANEIGIRILPGGFLSVDAKDGAAARTCVGAFTTGSGFRIFEHIRFGK